MLKLWWQTKPPGALGKNAKAQTLRYFDGPRCLDAR